MTSHSDDELGALLVETFQAHEHLADPERAIAIARLPRSSRHLGRVVLGAAAAVALVAGGTAYGLTRGTATGGREQGPSHHLGVPVPAGRPPLPPLETDAHNRALALAAVGRLAGRLPAFPGSRRTSRNPVLARMGLMSYGPPGNTVTRSRWWSVPGAAPQAVARWYAAHPAAGFRSENGVDSMSSSAPGRPTVTVFATDYGRSGYDVLPPHGESAEIETMAVPGGTVVRATAISIWNPARPAASYVQDVSSIDVRVVHTRIGHRESHRTRAFTITGPARVLRVATAFDSLPGAPSFVHSCPLIRDISDWRIVFHTATGDVTARYESSNCAAVLTVSRAGHQVGPALGDLTRLLPLLRP
jgi:hypothetical protein